MYPANYYHNNFASVYIFIQKICGCTLAEPINQSILKYNPWHTTIYHMCKCMSCNKTVMITDRVYCLNDSLYYPYLFFIRFEDLLFHESLWLVVLCSLSSFLSTLLFIGISNMYPCMIYVSTCVTKKTIW